MKVGKRKMPMRIVLKFGEPFGFAGLWESWKAADGQMVRPCTIITTTSNSVMETIHNRMPVILPREGEPVWLDQDLDDTAQLRELLVPYPVSEMEAYEVSPLANSPGNDVPECIARIR